MQISPFKKVIIVLLITLIAAFISLPREFSILEQKVSLPNLDVKLGRFSINKTFDLSFGLDLSGGSHLVFEADTSKVSEERKKSSVEAARNVIERRVNLFGISEPSVQTSSFEGKERIIVELPGIKDTKAAVDLIGKTAQLTFTEIEESLTEPIEGAPEEATTSATLKPIDLTGADLAYADVTFDTTDGKPAVSLQFTKEGGEKFSMITEANVGKLLPILLDEEIISAPEVREKITGGSAQISGDFSLEDAKNLSIQLNAGALPIPINLVEERTVGATLGNESIEKSVKAGVVGLVMVLAFMILSYGRLGLIAGFGLVVFGLITLALYKLIPVTLTLPGIAGFLLSVGMAVDSNILIFERFKEEKLKRPWADALEVAFGRAWDSIRDANIATLMTCFILANPLDWSFLHISGPVRGFAITLALGIAISLFTGIFVSRNLLRVFIKESPKKV